MKRIMRIPDQSGGSGSNNTPAFNRAQLDATETCENERARLHALAVDRWDKLVKANYKIKADYGFVEFESDRINDRLPQGIRNKLKEEIEAQEFIEKVNQMPCYKVHYWSERMGVEQQEVTPANALDLFQRYLQAETHYFQEWIRINFMDPIKLTVELPQILQQSMDEMQQQFQAIGTVGGGHYLPTAYQAVKIQVEHLIEETQNPHRDQKKTGKPPTDVENEDEDEDDETLEVQRRIQIEGYLDTLLAVLEQTLGAEEGVEPESPSLFPFNRLEYLQAIFIARISQESKKAYEAMMKDLEKHPERAVDPAYGQKLNSYSQDLSTVTRANESELAVLGAKYQIDVTQLPPTARLYHAVNKTITQRMVELLPQFNSPEGIALAQTDSKRWFVIKAEYDQLGVMKAALSETDLAGLEKTARILGLQPEDYLE